MTSTATPLPYPPIHSLVTHDDQGPAITLATAFCMIVSIIFYASRIWIRFPWSQLFSYDDAATSAAIVISVVQSVLVMAAVGVGLGKREDSLDNDAVQHVEKMLYSSSILYVISLCLGKLAVALLFVRLSSGQKVMRISRAICVACLIWGLLSLFLVAIRKDGNDSWDWDANTRGTYIRWVVVETIGAALEVAILAFSVLLVWNLQMSTYSKVTVVTGFALRTPIFVIIALRLWINHAALQDSPPVDSTFTPTLPEIFIQLEMHFNLICATVPCLRIFLKNFRTGYLDGALGMPDLYHDENNSGTHLATKGSGNYHDLKTNNQSPMELRSLDRGETKSKVTHGALATDNNNDASDGSGRRILIRQTVDVNFE